MDDIESLKESCLNDLFQELESTIQIQISNVFSLASPEDVVQTSESIETSKQFDSEAILQNLPDGNHNAIASVTSTTTEVSSVESIRKKNPSESIKNDGGSSVQLKETDQESEKREDPEPEKEDSVTRERGEDCEDDRLVIQLDHDGPDELPDSTWSPPSPRPARVFKTDLSQFFSKPNTNVIPLATQGGQNVISVDDDCEDTEDSREILRSASPRKEVSLPVKRKRGRPVGSKNKKKTIPPHFQSTTTTTTTCRRCFFLRKNRRAESGLMVCEDCGNIIGDHVIPGLIHAVPADQVQVAVSAPLDFPIFVAGTEIVVEGDKIIEVTSPRGRKIVKVGDRHPEVSISDGQRIQRESPRRDLIQQTENKTIRNTRSQNIVSPIVELEFEMPNFTSAQDQSEQDKVLADKCQLENDKMTKIRAPDVPRSGIIKINNNSKAVSCPVKIDDSLDIIHEKILNIQRVGQKVETTRTDLLDKVSPDKTPEDQEQSQSVEVIVTDLTPEMIPEVKDKSYKETSLSLPQLDGSRIQGDPIPPVSTVGKIQGDPSPDLKETSSSPKVTKIKVKSAEELMMRVVGQTCFRCGSSDSSGGPWHKHKRKENSFLCHLCFCYFRQDTSLVTNVDIHVSFYRWRAAEKLKAGAQTQTGK